jgi:hypothetical protein
MDIGDTSVACAIGPSVNVDLIITKQITFLHR